VTLIDRWVIDAGSAGSGAPCAEALAAGAGGRGGGGLARRRCTVSAVPRGGAALRDPAGGHLPQRHVAALAGVPADAAPPQATVGQRGGDVAQPHGERRVAALARGAALALARAAAAAALAGAPRVSHHEQCAGRLGGARCGGRGAARAAAARSGALQQPDCAGGLAALVFRDGHGLPPPGFARHGGKTLELPVPGGELAATVRVDSIVVRHRLRGWCAVTARRRQHRASLLRMQLALVERLRAKREGRVMQSWGQWARCQRELTVRVERHVVRTERAFALRVLAGWVAVYHQLCEQMANLRTCISRKRVAQKWFLRWYWDAFDTDIKVALTDILETPETAEVLDTYWTSDDLRDAGSAPTPARGQRQYSAVSRMAQVSPAGPADYPVEYGVLARADSRMSNINPVFDSGGSGVTRSSGGTPHTAVERSGGARSSEGHGRRSSMELYQESVAAYEATGAGTASLSTTVLQSTERMEMRQNVSYESFEHHGFTRFD
jgi:hypothetical protein